MPELHIEPRVPMTALSEPVVLENGSLRFAYESLTRDTITVSRLHIKAPDFYTGASVLVEGVAHYVGLPTDQPNDGIRAMWPRMAANGALAFQRGYGNVILDRDGQWVGTPGRSYGIWPIAVDAWNGIGVAYREAPMTTSQGVAGFLDDRWRLYDDIWQSPYQAAIPGRLFHGWRDSTGVLHLLSEYGKRVDQSDSAVLYWNDREQVVKVVMRYGNGHSTPRWPRGCTLPDGRVYVHASDLAGYYRAAIGPFTERFIENEETKPMPKVTILPGWSATAVAGEPYAVAVTTEDATSAGVRLVREDNGSEDSAEVPLPGGLVTLVPLTPGIYYLRAWASKGTVIDQSSANGRRVSVTVPPPPPPPQVITEEDREGFEALTHAMRAAVGEVALTYPNSRCAGQFHPQALSAYKEAVVAAIAALPVG